MIMAYSRCEQIFLEGGPFYHLYTRHIEDDLLFRTEEELNQALNIIAVAVFFAGCKVLAFAIMNNHLHFILEGPESQCRAFYSFIQKKLAFVLGRSGRGHIAQMCTPSFVTINSLKQLRDEIVYVIRNPFVDRVNVNMHAYKWCSGYLYFNPFLEEMFVKGVSASKMTIEKRREFKRERNPDIDPVCPYCGALNLPVPAGTIESARIAKESLDAREKPVLYRVYSLDIESSRPDEWLIEACKRTGTRWSEEKED